MSTSAPTVGVRPTRAAMMPYWRDFGDRRCGCWRACRGPRRRARWRRSRCGTSRCRRPWHRRWLDFSVTGSLTATRVAVYVPSGPEKSFSSPWRLGRPAVMVMVPADMWCSCGWLVEVGPMRPSAGHRPAAPSALRWGGWRRAVASPPAARPRRASGGRAAGRARRGRVGLGGRRHGPRPRRPRPGLRASRHRRSPRGGWRPRAGSSAWLRGRRRAAWASSRNRSASSPSR